MKIKKLLKRLARDAQTFVIAYDTANPDALWHMDWRAADGRTMTSDGENIEEMLRVAEAALWGVTMQHHSAAIDQFIGDAERLIALTQQIDAAKEARHV